MKNKLTIFLSLLTINTFAVESGGLTIETDAPNTTAQMQVDTAHVSKSVNKTKAKNKSNRSRKKKAKITIDEMHFDFVYSGDLHDAVKKLQDYDFSLNIASSLGKKQPVNISVDVQNTSLDELIRIINGQADGYATLQYNPNNNSIKIIYASKIRDIGYDAMMESKKWRDGNKPKPIITSDGILEYPFGFYQPVIPCKIGMICDIRLGKGEVLMDWAISDMGNWQMYSKKSGGDGSGAEPSLAFSGSDNNIIPHILIKPTIAATTTNLVVLTNKRTYNMLLKASNSDYVLSAGFYFPNMMMQGVEDEKQSLRDKASGDSNGGNMLASNSDDMSDSGYNVNISALNYNDYEVSGDDVSWKPTAVIDDGERVWIKFANDNQVSPILVETNPDNPSQPYKLIRYFPQAGNMYLVNRLFDEAMLVVGINDQTKTVYIKRKKAKKSFFQRIFG